MIITDLKYHVLKTEVEGKIYAKPDYTNHKLMPLVLVRVMTDAGIEGNVIAYLINHEYLEGGIDLAKSIVVGKDPHYREEINQKLYIAGVSSRGYPPMLSVIDFCLWDIAAKAANLPLYKYIGAYRDRIRGYASTIIYDTIEDYVRVAKDCVKMGFNCVKIHPHGKPDEDIEICRAVRAELPNIDLMLDPVGVYDRVSALRVGRAIEKLNFYWYEHPIKDEDIDGLIHLRGKLDIPIASTEFLRYGFPLYHQYLARGACDYVRGIFDYNGGITQAIKTAHMCEGFNVFFEGHSFGSSLIQAGYLNVALAIRNSEFMELIVPQGCLDHGMKEGIKVAQDGFVYAPVKPGLGYEIDWDVVENLTMRVV